MSFLRSFFTRGGERKRQVEATEPAWCARKPAKPASGWFGRAGRREPSAYQRCLAVHVYFAGRPSALSDR
jgi:hypothetical protein